MPEAVLLRARRHVRAQRPGARSGEGEVLDQKGDQAEDRPEMSVADELVWLRIMAQIWSERIIIDRAACR